MSRNLAFIDIETSGLRVLEHEVIEVGYIIPRNSDDWWEIEFSLPFNESRADPEALKVNGWGRRPFAPPTSVGEACSRMARHLLGLHLVVKNPAFDVKFLSVLMEKNQYVPTWHHRSIDIGSLVQGFFDRPEPLGSKEVAELVNVPLPDDQHTALADARWNKRVYEALELKSAVERGV